MTQSTTKTAEIAADLNAHLESGGVVRVATNYRHTIYEAKHAGWFFVGKDGCLHVRQGRTSLCLTLPNGTLLLSVQKGRYAAQ